MACRASSSAARCSSCCESDFKTLSTLLAFALAPFLIALLLGELLLLLGQFVAPQFELLDLRLEIAQHRLLAVARFRLPLFPLTLALLEFFSLLGQVSAPAPPVGNLASRVGVTLFDFRTILVELVGDSLDLLRQRGLDLRNAIVLRLQEQLRSFALLL